MSQQKDIYCDLGFWHSLSGKLSTAQLSPDLDDCRRIKTLLNWYGLICRSNMYFDCSVEDFDTASKDDLYLKSIWKRSTDGRCKLEFEENAISKMLAGPEKMDFNMYNALFLTKDRHEVDSEKVGVISVSSNELFEHDELFCDNGLAIKKEDVVNWRSILESAKVLHNCNAMVLVDNYAFEKAKYNLYEILDTLLPKKLDARFYLTIFFYNYGPERIIEDNEKALKAKIEELRPDLSLTVEVFGITKNDFHDREIITNYMYVGIGSGFDLISQRKTEKSTALHAVYPMIISEEESKWSKERYQIIINDAKKCLNKRGKSSKNRLLR